VERGNSIAPEFFDDSRIFLHPPQKAKEMFNAQNEEQLAEQLAAAFESGPGEQGIFAGTDAGKRIVRDEKSNVVEKGRRVARAMEIGGNKELYTDVASAPVETVMCDCEPLALLRWLTLLPGILGRGLASAVETRQIWCAADCGGVLGQTANVASSTTMH
jgi:hypothetical protein